MSASDSKGIVVSWTPKQVTTPTVTPTVDIKANDSDGPISIPYNSSATLSWTSSGAVSGCQVLKKVIGDNVIVAPNGSMNTGTLIQNTYFYVSCNNDSLYDTVTVNILPATGSSAPSVTLTANPAIVKSGESSTFTITSSNAYYCYSNMPGYDGRINGPITFVPTYSTTYNITCYNNVGQSASATAQINVTTPPPSTPLPPPTTMTTEPTTQYPGKTGTGVSLQINGQHDGVVAVTTSGSINYAWSAPNMFFCEFTSPFNSGVESSGNSTISYGHPFFPTSSNPTKTFTVRCYTHDDYIAGKVTGSDSVTVSLASSNQGAAVYSAIAQLLGALQTQLNKFK
jgi:hypothetical protein